MKFFLKKGEKIFLLLLFSILAFNMGQKNSYVLSAETEITYPTKIFEDGKAKHFQYKIYSKTGKNITIRYFLLKSSDGVIRAAFDACDVCWAEGKGYFQKGDFMVCRNCGRRFASVKINEVQGGCNPAPLKREIKGDKVVIKIKDLLEGAKYFDFEEGRK